MKFFEIYVKTKTGIIEPVVLDKVTVNMEENGAPSIMKFSVVLTEELGIDYGNMVTFRVKGEPFFVGYIFKLKPIKDETVEIMCYDTLRYLKNKGSYVFKDQSYSDMLKKICSDFGMPLGKVDDTGFKLKGRIENDKEFWEILMNASAETTANTNNIFILYDKGNEINLINRKDFKVDSCVVNKSSFQDYDYEGSIDENTFNSVYIKQIDDEGATIKPHTLKDDEHIDDWGILQYYACTTEKESAINEKMKHILQLTNRPTRKFKALKVIGDINVRAGCLVPVFYKLYDLTINGYMVATSVTHEFESGGYHFMDMTLYNIDIMPTIKVDGIFEDATASKNSSGGNFTGAPTGAGNKFINLVTQKEGRPYVWGASGANDSYDCSGLVTWGLQQMGVLGSGQRLTTATMPNSSLLEKIPVSQAQPGDLVWRRSGNSGHVAVVVGPNKTFEAKSKNSGIGYGSIGDKYMAAYRVKEFYA